MSSTSCMINEIEEIWISTSHTNVHLKFIVNSRLKHDSYPNVWLICGWWIFGTKVLVSVLRTFVVLWILHATGWLVVALLTVSDVDVVEWLLVWLLVGRAVRTSFWLWIEVFGELLFWRGVCVSFIFACTRKCVSLLQWLVAMIINSTHSCSQNYYFDYANVREQWGDVGRPRTTGKFINRKMRKCGMITSNDGEA